MQRDGLGECLLHQFNIRVVEPLPFVLPIFIADPVTLDDEQKFF